MTYEQLIETISLIVETEKIQKVGLNLHYELDEKQHLILNEEIYRRTNPYSNNFTLTDEFEVMIAGILVKFTKRKLQA
jgi:hypothetical protein